MNAKAEKIEQLIQVVKRNLLLIYADQADGVAPLEGKSLRKLGGNPFGNDKFAYEMVHFAHADAANMGGDVLAQEWNNNFMRGLELLLCEAALVRDDIERDCFVSRIYVWFNEKLVERRDLPKPTLTQDGISGLRSSISSMGATNTAKALDSYGAKLPEIEGATPADGVGVGEAEVSQSGAAGSAPPVLRPGSQGDNRAPLYVKHAYPAIMKQETRDFHVGRTRGHRRKEEANMGMLHYAPETEAEKTMHTLWLARRREEAFEWKTQQQLAVAMDRLAVHKSRLESDALRRQESSHFLEVARTASRPSSAVDSAVGKVGGGERPRATSPQRPWSAQTPEPRFAARMERPMSANAAARFAKSRRPPTVQERLDEERRLQEEAEAVAAQMDEEARIRQEQEEEEEEEEEGTQVTELEGVGVESNMGTLPVVVKTAGAEPEQTAVPKSSRTSIKKESSSFTPMRYGISQGTGSTTTPGKTLMPRRKQQFKTDQLETIDYMVNYDSDEESKGLSTRGGGGGDGDGEEMRRKVVMKSSKSVPRRDRPQSATMLRDVANADPELKVHYRQSNFRRMPMTDEQNSWLDAQEKTREKKMAARIEEMKAAASAKGDKGKGDKDKGKDKGGKDKGGKDKGKGKGKAEPEEKPKIKCKYKSADDFMRQHFPNFDSEGPLRTWQLLEVKQILEQVGEQTVTESALVKALVIPQDKPESICQEGLRKPGEGLMVNPLPEEFWRKGVEGGGKKKGGKKGKKKK